MSDNDGLYMGYKQGMKAGFELGQKSTKTTDAPAELITGEELLDQFNSQSSDISSYVTLTEFIDRELQKAYELGQKAQWRPMETAPKDGTQIIVKFVNDSNGTVEIKNAWFEGSWRRICENRNAYEYFSFGKVVGWMPLPEPPGE